MYLHRLFSYQPTNILSQLSQQQICECSLSLYEQVISMHQLQLNMQNLSSISMESGIVHWFWRFVSHKDAFWDVPQIEMQSAVKSDKVPKIISRQQAVESDKNKTSSIKFIMDYCYFSQNHAHLQHTTPSCVETYIEI